MSSRFWLSFLCVIKYLHGYFHVTTKHNFPLPHTHAHRWKALIIFDVNEQLELSYFIFFPLIVSQETCFINLPNTGSACIPPRGALNKFYNYIATSRASTCEQSYEWILTKILLNSWLLHKITYRSNTVFEDSKGLCTGHKCWLAAKSTMLVLG